MCRTGRHIIQSFVIVLMLSYALCIELQSLNGVKLIYASNPYPGERISLHLARPTYPRFSMSTLKNSILLVAATFPSKSVFLGQFRHAHLQRDSFDRLICYG